MIHLTLDSQLIAGALLCGTGQDVYLSPVHISDPRCFN